MILRRLHHVAHALGGSDIAGIDAQAGGTRLGRFDGALIVEMDIGHDGHLHRLHDGRQGRGRFLVGAGDAHDIGAGRLQLANLRDRRRGIGRQGVRHRLHRDGRIAADGHLAYVDLPALAPVDVAVGTDTHDLGFLMAAAPREIVHLIGLPRTPTSNLWHPAANRV